MPTTTSLGVTASMREACARHVPILGYPLKSFEEGQLGCRPYVGSGSRQQALDRDRWISTALAPAGFLPSRSGFAQTKGLSPRLGAPRVDEVAESELLKEEIPSPAIN